MNRVIITMIVIVVVLSAIFTAYAIMNDSSEKQVAKEEKLDTSEEIYDECTDEYEKMQTEVTNANTEQEKTSPNCALIIKTYFKKCGHITSQYANLPEEFVNLSKEEIQEKYELYTIQSFAKNEIVLYQEKEGECGEHYLVKDNEGIVTIYKILEDEKLQEQETTSIATEYLPETDKMNMKNGIRVDGKQALNQLIEDYE